MAGSVNKVILIGNLGKDPEVRHLNTGVMVTTIPVATSESFKDRTSGEMREITEWHNVVLWRGLAEIADKYLRKGSKVYIEGKLKTRSWDDNGHTRYTTEVVADNLTLLDKAPSSSPKVADQVEDAVAVPMDMPTTDLNKETSDDLPF